MSSTGRLGLSRPVWLIGWVSFFTDAASEMIYPLLPLFLTRVLGAGAMSLGVIEGVAEAANSVLKVVSGRLADTTGRPRRLMLIGYTISSAMRPLIGVAAGWTQVLAIRFADRLGKGIRGAPRDAMLADFAPDGQRGRVYGFHRAMDHAGAVAGPLIASLFLYFYPGDYRTLFTLTIIPGIAVVLIILLIPERGSVASGNVPSGSVASGSVASGLSRKAPSPQSTPLLISPHLWKALAVIALFGLGNASDAFLLLRLSEVGIPAVWIPLLWSGLHVVKVISSIAGGELSDRLGRRHTIAAGWLFYGGVYAAFALTTSTATLIGVFLAYGIYFGLTEGVEKAWVADLSARDALGTAFGYYNATIGISALLASLAFGLIWTRVSPEAAFLTGASLAALATALLYLLFPDEANPRHQR